ncbi:MAG TPA: hypothetical protein VK724_17690 [Bryobacteraceae bacterium]|jgi:hypothetical protein|nr:hypothetical protein [Bryobacteraceae bacterium]
MNLRRNRTAPRVARYLVSLPERVVRSAAALAGGLIREIGDVSLPAAVRRTKTYQMMVDIALRFMIERVGEVKGVYPTGDGLASDFLLRRTAGHGIELAGLLAFRASPVWIMAALADVSGAGRHIVQEIAEAMQQEGLLAPEARFENVDQLLEGLEQTASQVADLCNAPPLDVAGLRREWATFRTAVAKIPPRNLPTAGFLREHWDELKAEAAAQNRGVFELSSVMAVSALARVPVTLLRLARATNRAAWRSGQTLGGSVLLHYSQVLGEIHERGYAAYWAEEFRPYLRAAADQFSPRHRSLTTRFINRLGKSV